MFVEASTLENWNFTEELSGGHTRHRVATAVIWLKKGAAAARGQISSNLSAFPGISQVDQVESQPSIMRIRFDFNKIRYSEIINKINQMGYEAKVVGY